MPDEEQRQGIRSRQERRREAGEQERHRRHHRQLDGDQHRRPDRGRAQRIPGEVENRRQHAQHQADIRGQEQHQTRVAPEAEGPARHRLGQRREDGLALDLAGHHPPADDHRQQRPGQLDRAQPHVEDDPQPVADGELGHEQRPADEQRREEEQVVEQLAAHQFAHGVGGDGRDDPVHQCTSRWVESPKTRSRSAAVDRAVPPRSSR